MARVPCDMWICCACRNGNLLPLADYMCPACGHARDQACIGPGETIPPTMVFTSRHSDIPYPALPSYYPASTDYACDRSTATAHGYGHANQHGGRTNYTQTPNDMWHCNECGADNLTWTEFCPVCGNRTRSIHGSSGSMTSYSSHYEVLSLPTGYITYGPAGSTAPGAWECQECGAANGVLDDWCAACGEKK
jgi:hypothetical protein